MANNIKFPFKSKEELIKEVDKKSKILLLENVAKQIADAAGKGLYKIETNDKVYEIVREELYKNNYKTQLIPDGVVIYWDDAEVSEKKSGILMSAYEASILSYLGNQNALHTISDAIEDVLKKDIFATNVEVNHLFLSKEVIDFLVDKGYEVDESGYHKYVISWGEND